MSEQEQKPKREPKRKLKPFNPNKIKPEGDSRPGSISEYSPELADWICELVSTHPIGLAKLYEKYKDQGFPHADTIAKWRYMHEDFKIKFRDAKVNQVELYVEQTYELADDLSRDLIMTDKGEVPNSSAVARAKIQIDIRKWHAGRLMPKMYGDKTYVENKVSLSHEEMLKELE